MSDYYKYNPSVIPVRAWMIHVGYNTYVLTVLLGSINVMFYFISTILLWRWLKNGNGFIMNDNKTGKEHNESDLEK